MARKKVRRVIICAACGRERPHHARQWCSVCYNRWDVAGRPESGPPPQVRRSPRPRPAEPVIRPLRDADRLVATVLPLAAEAIARREEVEAPVAGACEGMDVGIFFPDRGESVAVAREVCEGCPFGVRVACLLWAVVTPERDGVWGGMTPEERVSLRRRAQRAVIPEAQGAA
ncbi:hypothetical protein GCM10027294_25420 [Marinactinospora endophytica]